ncbi:MAG: TIGR03576 family pyridoxal phosphate-dependent enzyme [Methanobacteriaceae archaeon]|jgi:L-seryl-tRNA(Ser) seleniumtransferase
MIISSPHDEMKRREAALKFISFQVKHDGRSNLYDLTGLSGGFPLEREDLDLLETYAGSAIFDEALQKVGKEHLGGEKILAFNRTSAAILATILALVKPGEEVIHFLPELPSHPSIPRTAKLIGASYQEYDSLDEFQITPHTALVVITGSTMDHQLLAIQDFQSIIGLCQSSQVTVLVDDASGARLRTIIYGQPRALDMGADLVVTSTDKLLDGPRGGLMSGNVQLIDRIKTKALQFGLEAQTPLLAGMVKALMNFDPERILKAFGRKKTLYRDLRIFLPGIQQTPTGIMLSPESLLSELTNKDFTVSLSAREAATLFAMILLKKHHIITIPAVGMPGVSATIRMDLASKDAENLDDEYLINAFVETLSYFQEIIKDVESCREFLYA